MQFEYATGSPKDPLLWGDRDKVIQVLTNIISNAMQVSPRKAGDHGRARPERATWAGWRADTGKGIAPEDIPKYSTVSVSSKASSTIPRAVDWG